MQRKDPVFQRIELGNLLNMAASLSVILLALLAWIAALNHAQIILAPISLAIIIGLMVLPAVQRLERLGLSPWLSAAAVVLIFLIIIMMVIIGFALPISAWVERAPQIWESLRLQINSWRATLESFNQIREQLGQVAGAVDAMKVSVDGNSGVETVITLAPLVLAQILLFLVSLYFFLATRDNFRTLVLTLCITRGLRWRTARVFRDVEYLMSRYLFSITLINFGLGLCTSAALWLIGMPTPLLWGMLAAVLNYIVYAGPAVMAAILLAVSLATNDGALGVLLPPAVYLSLNLIESQFVTTRVLGSSTTINPFPIFLSLTFWLWLWGPIGGFIAVPSLLILSAAMKNIVPYLAIAGPPPATKRAQETM